MSAEYLWSGSDPDELFNGKTNIQIKDASNEDLYVRCDHYFNGRYIGPYHLEEDSEKKIRWVKHKEGGQMKPITRWAFMRWLEKYPIPLQHT